MTTALFILWLGCASVLGQCSFTFDLASFGGAAGAVPVCSNNVTWAPATSTVDWYETNGGPSHYTVALAEFQTNCTYKIGAVTFLGSVGNYITNISGLYSLTNCTFLRVETQNGLDYLNIAGMFNCTNFTINSNPDLGTIRLGDNFDGNTVGIPAAYTVNISLNSALGSFENEGDMQVTNIHLWAMNNCNFSDEWQTNIACIIWGVIDSNSLSNGTYATEANAETIADPSCIWAMTNFGWTISY